MSFWLDDYLRLLAFLQSAGRKAQTVAEFLRDPGRDAAILRHDVDRQPSQAVRMAEREHAAGHRASYYFRCDSEGQFPAACRRIAELGHEIGYHFEDLARCRGDREAARARFRRHLARLRAIAPCVTVSMHGSPLSRWDNGTLFDATELGAFQLLGDASLSLQSHAPIYFTDAGGAWNDPRVNFRDRVGMMPPGANPLSESELRKCLASNPGRPVYFNVHPERWSVSRMSFVLAVARDVGAHGIKAVLRLARK